MIALAPLPHDRVADVLHLLVGAGQDIFVHPIAEMVTDRVPGVAFHAARRDGGEVVGFFKTDRDYAERHDFAPPGIPGLRGMLIGAQYQGKGYGRAVMAALPAYLAGVFPGKSAILLTVNCTNPLTRHVYLAGGWRDTGALYQGGRTGPQHILQLDLGRG